MLVCGTYCVLREYYHLSYIPSPRVIFLKASINAIVTNTYYNNQHGEYTLKGFQWHVLCLCYSPRITFLL